MQFHFQRLGRGVKADSQAELIIEHFARLEHPSPGALMESLRQWSQANALKLHVAQFGGVINVHGDGGIILRIRPTE